MREGVSEAVFVTADHFIFGKISTAPKRFSDVLNDPMVSWIVLLEAELARPNEPRKIVATFPEMLLAKAHILMAIITQEPLDDTQGHLHKYAHRKPEHIYVCIPPYEVEGVGYLEKGAELHTILSTEAREFIPLAEAIIVHTVNPEVRLRAEVMLVNRRAICGLSRSEEVSEEGEPQEQPCEGAPSEEKG
ncbi:MAG: hypothetical protein MUP04_09730 [Anaerolineae bacterium]|nr:hypothetical protein [Anaerolineae bacterium]